MNSTHGLVGVGATSATAWLTTLLTGFHGLDADHAAAAAGLIVMGAGAIYSAVSWLIKWKWPTAPLPPAP